MDYSGFFTDEAVKLEILRKRAYNMRWAEQPEGVLPMTAADPDFPACPEVVRAIKDYADAGYFSYTPGLGLPEFKEAIAGALKRRKNEDVDPAFVLPIDSAARAMHVTAAMILQPGDEMIVWDPVDFLFRASCESAGGKAVLFPTILNEEGKVDISRLEEYVTPNTRMIGLCNPHNPVGSLYSKKDLELLLDIADRHGLWIMSDEIWSDIVYPENEFLSLFDPRVKGNKERVIGIYGFSKTFGVAGLRIGCIYCTNKELFDRIVDASGVLSTAGGIASICQVAGAACMNEGFDYFDAFLKHLTANRDYAWERLNAIEGISCRKPQATYLMFPDISSTGMRSEELTAHLLDKAKLAIVPGSKRFFGPGAEGHVRICIATSRGILKEGLDRFEYGLSLL
ncbi:MAG: pyridoxal phosphate-dependent aminotransferase [Firmicutes bacterium]|nr:pyridoxal phosphate-dependent aminotransferase [Bacillota bacterium]